MVRRRKMRQAEAPKRSRTAPSTSLRRTRSMMRLRLAQAFTAPSGPSPMRDTSSEVSLMSSRSTGLTFSAAIAGSPSSASDAIAVRISESETGTDLSSAACSSCSRLTRRMAFSTAPAAGSTFLLTSWTQSMWRKRRLNSSGLTRHSTSRSMSRPWRGSPESSPRLRFPSTTATALRLAGRRKRSCTARACCASSFAASASAAAAAALPGRAVLVPRLLALEACACMAAEPMSGALST
mmetsp:Transcript_17617/g.38436  ORF Transcript_17617/g.38436 Transcript_17617/m.38436 type:complete len:238 (+) Transcript_17617:663-1376(+)